MSIIRSRRGESRKASAKGQSKLVRGLGREVVAENEPVVPFPRTYFV